MTEEKSWSDSVAESARNAVEDVKSALHEVDNGVRGLANGLTLGEADRIVGTVKHALGNGFLDGALKNMTLLSTISPNDTKSFDESIASEKKISENLAKTSDSYNASAAAGEFVAEFALAYGLVPRPADKTGLKTAKVSSTTPTSVYNIPSSPPSTIHDPSHGLSVAKPADDSAKKNIR